MRLQHERQAPGTAAPSFRTGRPSWQQPAAASALGRTGSFAGDWPLKVAAPLAPLHGGVGAPRLGYEPPRTPAQTRDELSRFEDRMGDMVARRRPSSWLKMGGAQM